MPILTIFLEESITCVVPIEYPAKVSRLPPVLSVAIVVVPLVLVNLKNPLDDVFLNSPTPPVAGAKTKDSVALDPGPKDNVAVVPPGLGSPPIDTLPPVLIFILGVSAVSSFICNSSFVCILKL